MKVKGKHEFEATPSVNGNAIALANQVSAADHAHGNITNDGKVGSTANLPLITSTDGAVIAGSFGTDANSFCQGNDARLSDARTPTAHNHDASDVNSGTLDAARVPTLDAAKIGSGVLDIARIPAAAIERMVPVADQAARFALTTATVQLGDTVKQLDTGIMYVVIDTANLANAAGYSEYTAATAAAVPWSGVQTKPTTLSGYGITDATPSSHVGATGAAHGAVTTSVNGFMSAADKTKLDGIATGAQVNVGTNIGTGTVTTTTVPLTSSTGTGTTLNAATTSLAGVMSAADKAKLDGIATGATANVGTVTSVSGTAPISVANGTSTPSITISAATTSAAGSMSAADKTKLNGIATGATANTAYTSTPAAPTTTGSAGANAAYARGDHAHPSRIATSAPASPVNGDIWMV